MSCLAVGLTLSSRPTGRWACSHAWPCQMPPLPKGTSPPATIDNRMLKNSVDHLSGCHVKQYRSLQALRSPDCAHAATGMATPPAPACTRKSPIMRSTSTQIGYTCSRIMISANRGVHKLAQVGHADLFVCAACSAAAMTLSDRTDNELKAADGRGLRSAGLKMDGDCCRNQAARDVDADCDLCVHLHVVDHLTNAGPSLKAVTTARAIPACRTRVELGCTCPWVVSEISCGEAGKKHAGSRKCHWSVSGTIPFMCVVIHPSTTTQSPASSIFQRMMHAYKLDCWRKVKPVLPKIRCVQAAPNHCGAQFPCHLWSHTHRSVSHSDCHQPSSNLGVGEVHLLHDGKAAARIKARPVKIAIGRTCTL